VYEPIERGIVMAVKEKEVVDTTTGEIVPVSSIKQINTMDAKEYQAWLASEGQVVEAFDGGSEWTLVGDKADLINVPFVIAMIRWNDTAEGGTFVSVCCFKEDGTKIVFNDGSTGVYQQLQTYTLKHQRDTGIFCAKGLRKSDYIFTNKDTGKETPATTYYIA